MAKVTKRRVEAGAPKGSAARSGNPRVAASARSAAPADPSVDRDDDHPFGNRRYTPPASGTAQLPSPMWVPVLMFFFFGVGVLTIVLSYTAVLPGSPSGLYLVGGLLAILAGIITATQYR